MFFKIIFLQYHQSRFEVDSKKSSKLSFLTEKFFKITLELVDESLLSEVLSLSSEVLSLLFKFDSKE